MEFLNYFFHPTQLKQLIVIGITLVFMSKSYAEIIALGFIQLVESFIVTVFPRIVSALEQFPHLYVQLPKVTVHKVKFKKEQFPRKLFAEIRYLNCILKSNMKYKSARTALVQRCFFEKFEVGTSLVGSKLKTLFKIKQQSHQVAYQV